MSALFHPYLCGRIAAEWLITMENKDLRELTEEELENVSGGYSVGDVVRIRNNMVVYCNNCGALLMNYEATIRGVRGVLNGHTVYWITRKCCGHKTSEIETAFV